MMIEIAALKNGAHRNQTCHGIVPDGWAVVPNGMELENFPFGEAETAVINGVMTLTAWTPAEIPETEEAQPTQLDYLEAQVTYTAMMTDTLLEV